MQSSLSSFRCLQDAMSRSDDTNSNELQLPWTVFKHTICQSFQTMVRQGNHCHAGETATPGPGARIAAATSRGSRAKKRPVGAPRPRPTGSRTSPRKKRIRSPEDKLEILRAYLEWIEQGKPRKGSPVSKLVLKYGCSTDYPKQLYDKVKRFGSTDSQWVPNPKGIPEAAWIAMVDLIRAKRGECKIASCRYIARKLTATFGTHIGKNVVCAAKRRMGFKTVKICIKPLLNTKLMDERYAFANKMKGKKFTHVLHADEKWFTEEKAEQMAVTARPSSPVARFRGKQAETRTQLDKLMFLTVVYKKKKIGQYELDFKEWNAVHVNSRTGKVAKGVTSDMLALVLRKIARDARRLLGPAREHRDLVRQGGRAPVEGDARAVPRALTRGDLAARQVARHEHTRRRRLPVDGARGRVARRDDQGRDPRGGERSLRGAHADNARPRRGPRAPQHRQRDQDEGRQLLRGGRVEFARSPCRSARQGGSSLGCFFGARRSRLRARGAR